MEDKGCINFRMITVADVKLKEVNALVARLVEDIHIWKKFDNMQERKSYPTTIHMRKRRAKLFKIRHTNLVISCQ